MADLAEDDTIDDIGADIGSALTELRQEPAAAAPTPAQAETPEPAAEAAQAPTEARARNPDGTFAKAEETGQSLEPAPQEPARTILPPRSWTAAAKAKFATLDPDVQQEVLRREKEIDDGKAQWDTKAEKYNKLDAVFAPVRDRLTLNGLTEDTYIRALVQADEMLRSNGPQAIQLLAQQYGINLAAMFGQQGGPQTQPVNGQPDPQIQALLQEVQALRAERQQETTQRQDQDKQATQAQIDAFANDPAHLYFDNVKPEMAALLQSGAAKDLPEAYDMACHARKDIRQLLAAAAVPKTASVQTRPNGSSITGAQRPGLKPNGAASTGKDDIGDDVRAAFAMHRGQV